MSTTLHMGVDRLFLRRMVELHGPKSVLTGEAKKLSKKEALALIDADPRQVICSCSCKKNDDGSCAGTR